MKYPRSWMKDLKASYDIEFRQFYLEMIGLEIFEERYTGYLQQYAYEKSISDEFWKDSLRRRGFL